MDFIVKVSFYFVMLSDACLYSFADTNSDYSLVTSCYAQYLHEKGKLDEPLKPMPVQSTSRCRLVIPYLANIFINRIADPFSPKAANCARNVVVNGQYYDNLLELHLHRSFLRDAKKLDQFKNRTHPVFDLINEIKVNCRDHDTDAIKNPTLEDDQLKYCIREYVLQNQILELNDIYDYDSSHHIDTERINCTNIVAVERNKTEIQFKKKLSASDCVMNEFRSGNLFDWKAAMIVLKGPFINGEPDRIDTMVQEFLSMPTHECAVFGMMG